VGERINCRLIHCGCGSLLIGRLHKVKYIYYKCRNHLSICPEACVRQETLEKEFTEAVYSLRFTEDFAERIRTALSESAIDKKQYKGTAVKRLRAEYDRLQRRLDLVYEDRLDGRITAAEYDNRAKQWRFRQDQINAELSGFEKADRIYMDEGLAILDLCQRFVSESWGSFRSSSSNRKKAIDRSDMFELNMEGCKALY
jgi:site-specific DNA recombinase